MTEMVPLEVDGKQRLTFDVPSRGLIGFRSAFATITRGSGLLHRAFSRYDEYRGPLDRVRKGVLVSTATGRTTLYALGMLEARGDLFVGDGGDVYEGMIIGESSRWAWVGERGGLAGADGRDVGSSNDCTLGRYMGVA